MEQSLVIFASAVRQRAWRHHVDDNGYTGRSVVAFPLLISKFDQRAYTVAPPFLLKRDTLPVRRLPLQCSNARGGEDEEWAVTSGSEEGQRNRRESANNLTSD
jgi:hypothetical protein